MNYSSVDVYKEIEEIRNVHTDLTVLRDVENLFMDETDLFKRIKVAGMIMSSLFIVYTPKSDKIYTELIIEDGLSELGILVEFHKEVTYKKGDYIKADIVAYRDMDRNLQKEYYKVVGDVEVIGKYSAKETKVKVNEVESENILGDIE